MLHSITRIRSFNFRDASASLVNYVGGNAWYNITVDEDTHYFSDFDYYASRGLTGVDFRAKNIESFDNLEANSLDFYASVKSLYLQDRKKKFLTQMKSLKHWMTVIGKK